MKKVFVVLAIILIISIIAITTLCTVCIYSYLCRYKDWQEIDVPEVGTFKIPPDWAYHRDGNRIYLTDKNVKAPTEENTYIVGSVRVTNDDEVACKIFDSNTGYGDVVSSAIFSNSARIWKVKYIIHGKLCTKVCLDMWAPSDAEIDMLVWDDSVDYKLVKKIAKSYAMHLKEDD